MSTRFLAVFYLTGYVAAYTGFLLLFFMGQGADFHATAKQVILKAHIASVVPWLFCCGMLFSIHVIPQLQARISEGRKTGKWLIVLLAGMSISGYLIQVMPTAGGIDTARLTHIVFGSGFSLLFVGHLYLVRPSLRMALSAVTAASILVSLPFFLIKNAPDLPEEIQLKPLSAADSELKKN